MIGAVIIRRMVRSAFEMMNRGDVDSLMSGWADDAIFDFPSIMSVGGTLKGKKEIAAGFRMAFEVYPKRKYVVRDICFQEVFPLLSILFGTYVIMADWTAELTNKEGKELKFDGLTVIHGRRNKHTHVRDYISFLGLPPIPTLIKPSGKA
jgi:ketosteroid isomerase-like protein